MVQVSFLKPNFLSDAGSELAYSCAQEEESVFNQAIRLSKAGIHGHER